MSEEGYEPDEGEQPAVETAFALERFTLGKIKLQPYTPSRVFAAQSMGLRFGFVDDAGLAQFNETGIYPGMLRDMAVLLWVCSITDRHEIDQAARSPVNAAEKAATWAHKHGLDVPSSEDFWEARRAFLGILGAVQAAETVPTGSGPTPQKKTKRAKKKR